MCGSITFGHVMAYYSPAEKDIAVDLGLSKTEKTLFNALAPIGAIFGGALMNVFTCRFGRKKPLFVTAVISLISWLLIGISKIKFYWISHIGRCITGISIGAFSQVCPMYITELAPDELRGAFGAMNQLGVTIGACLTYLWGVFFKWRTIAFISMIPSGLLIILIWFVIESPNFVRQNNEYNDISKTNESLFQAKFAKPILISFLLMFFQQFSGVNALLSNLEKIFQDSGSKLKPSIESFLVGFAGAISTGISSFLVEKLGRRMSWLISSISQFLLMLLVVINKYINISTYITLFCLFGYNFAFGLGLGPIPWFYIPEFFPDSVRSLICGIMTATNWIFVTIVMLIWPYMKEVVSYIFYTVVIFCSCLFGIFILKETKGKKMGDNIDENLITTE